MSKRHQARCHTCGTFCIAVQVDFLVMPMCIGIIKKTILSVKTAPASMCDLNLDLLQPRRHMCGTFCRTVQGDFFLMLMCISIIQGLVSSRPFAVSRRHQPRCVTSILTLRSFCAFTDGHSPLHTQCPPIKT